MMDIRNKNWTKVVSMIVVAMVVMLYGGFTGTAYAGSKVGNNGSGGKQVQVKKGKEDPRNNKGNRAPKNKGNQGNQGNKVIRNVTVIQATSWWSPPDDGNCNNNGHGHGNCDGSCMMVQRGGDDNNCAEMKHCGGDGKTTAAR